MVGVICGSVTAGIGAVLVILMSVLGYVLVPDIVVNTIVNEVALINDTVQFERFEEVPFPLNFTVRLWNIRNKDEVLAGGVPVVEEAGPYIYKLYQTRIIDEINGDNITYRRMDHFEFDPIASYPNSEDDLVTIINVPYNAVLQVAQNTVPNLMQLLDSLLDGIFEEHNSPISTFRVRDLLFGGVTICRDPNFVAEIVCGIIRSLSGTSQNMEIQADGSVLFSLLGYKDGKPSSTYVVSRGLEDHGDLGRIHLYNGLPYLQYWTGQGSQCNMINGTDSGIFAPFLTHDTILYAINTDICRSVDLRFQHELDYEGIPAYRFALNEWFLDNDNGCFCLNVTTGITRDDGCLLKGAIELFTCTGAYMVLSYPHFLFADSRYRNGVIGMNPDIERHRIFLDVEPNTGTVVRGAKRAQFNVFMRPVPGISETEVLRTTLMPIVWVEEGMSLPNEFVEEIKSKLLSTLDLLTILIPVLIAVSAIILLIGVLVIVIAKRRLPRSQSTIPMTRPELR